MDDSLKAAAQETVKAVDSSLAFTLKDQTGKEVRLSDFAGKIVVLEWLNPECPFVQAHYK
ncbi:MAG: redoxin domain-containing protein, partial [Phycisphaerae bacterium]|nr:redoxin domain-containing protein [Phycisphaerae bacterium]